MIGLGETFEQIKETFDDFKRSAKICILQSGFIKKC